MIATMMKVMVMMMMIVMVLMISCHAFTRIIVHALCMMLATTNTRFVVV